MNKIMMTALAAIALAGTLGAPAQAAQDRIGRSGQVIQDRYCLQGREYGYPGNCAFSTYSQCRASASGTESGCGINPRYGYSQQGWQ